MRREHDARMRRRGVTISTAGTPFVVAMGSNLGDRRSHLRAGLAFLRRRVEIDTVSRVVESEAWGPVAQGPFLNLVARGRSDGNVLELLELAQAAEEHSGRVRTERYGPRTLDVDIIFFADMVLESPLLTVPHPRWDERPFVSALLDEVAGDLPEPRSGRRVGEIVPAGPLPSELSEVPRLEHTSDLGEDEMSRRVEHE